MAEREEIILEVNPDLAIRGIRKANESMEQFETRMKNTLGEYVKYSERSKSTTDRLVQSIEKQAQAYGKTGVDRLIVQRDQMIQRLGKEQQAIDRVKAAYDKMISVEKGPDVSRWERFGTGIRDFIQHPLDAAGNALQGLVTKLGPAGIAIIGAGAAIAGAAKFGFEWAKQLGEIGDRTEDIAIRTGLSNKEVGQFSFAMKRAGGDISSVETAMRMLSKGLSESSEEGKKAREGLKELGISGAQPTSEILLQLSERLKAMPNTFDRNALAMKIMGRSALELLPDLLELSEGVKRAKELGFGMDDATLARYKVYQQQVAEIEAIWSRLARKAKEPIAATFVVTLKWLEGFGGPGKDAVNKGLSGANWWQSALIGGPSQDIPGPGIPVSPVSSPLSGMLANDQAAGARASDAFSASRMKTTEGMQDRLKEIGSSRAKLIEELTGGALGGNAFSAKARALAALDSEKKDLEAQVKAIDDAAKHAEAMAKEAEKGNKLIYEYRARVQLAQYGIMTGDKPIVPYAEGTGGGPGSDMLKNSGKEFSAALEKQIKQDEETLAQIRKTIDHMDQVDTEDIAKREADAEKVAKIYEKEFDRIRSSFEGLFDAAFSGAKNFWDSMRRFAVTLFLTPVKEAMSSMFANFMMGGGRGGATATAGGGGGILGSLLGSVPLIGGGSIFGKGSITGGPGGTGGFSGPVSAGGGTGGAGMLAGLGGVGSLALGGSALGLAGAYKLGSSDSKFKYAAPAIGAAAGMLGFGALSMMFPALIAAGPVGWIAAAGIGAAVGLIALFRKGAESKAREKIKAVWGVDVKDKGVLSQIVEMAKSGFGGNLDLAIRSTQVRDLVQLYAMSTGQRTTLANEVRPTTLSQIGGSLFQQPTYVNGSGYAYPGLQSSGSGSLSMISAGAQNTGTQVINLEVDSKPIAQLVMSNGNVVSQTGLKASRGRNEMRSLTLAPGTVMS
jgi:hypothetical protein